MNGHFQLWEGRTVILWVIHKLSPSSFYGSLTNFLLLFGEKVMKKDVDDDGEGRENSKSCESSLLQAWQGTLVFVISSTHFVFLHF